MSSSLSRQDIQPSPRRWAHALAMLAIALVYAACFTLIKAGLAYAPPLLFAGLRTLLAGAFLLVWLILRGRSFIPSHTGGPSVFLLALIGTSAVYGAMFLSPAQTSLGITIVLANLQPLATLVLAAFFLGERLTVSKGVGLGLGLLGIIVIAAPTVSTIGGSAGAGAALALVVSLASAIATVIVKRLDLRTDLLSVTAWQLILGSLPLLGASAIYERGQPITWNFEFVAALFALSAVGTALLTVAWYWLVQRDDIGWLTQFLYLVPTFGLGIAATTLGAVIRPSEALGAMMTLLATGIAFGTPMSPHDSVRGPGLDPDLSLRRRQPGAVNREGQ